MSRPEENDGLRELKRRWDDGHFAEDRHGVHGVDEAIDEASGHLSVYDHSAGSGKAKLGLTSIYAKFYADRNTADDAAPKACAICSRPSRNHHCDACYRMVRSAAEWVADPGRIPSGDDGHPCFICEEGDILSQICGACMDTILGE